MSGPGRRRLLIAGIHHGQWEQAPAANVLDYCSAIFLDAGWQVDSLLIEEQALFDQPATIAELMAHRRRQRALERRWRTYLGQPTILSDLLASLGQGLEWFGAHFRPATRANLDRNRQIQARVTAKHRQAIQAAAQSSDWLLVLESDATWRSNSAKALRALAIDLPDSGAWFMDLAGGISGLSDQHPIADSALLPESPVVLMDPAVTNTACAYLLSRDAAVAILDFADRHFEIDELAIDWLLNAAFMAAAGVQRSGTTVHFQCARLVPPALDHGSFTGQTRSWRSDL